MDGEILRFVEHRPEMGGLTNGGEKKNDEGNNELNLHRKKKSLKMFYFTTKSTNTSNSLVATAELCTNYLFASALTKQHK